MTDFFTRLVERTLGTARMVQPVIPSQFAPVQELDQAWSEEAVDVEPSSVGSESVTFNSSIVPQREVIDAPPPDQQDISPTTRLPEPLVLPERGWSGGLSESTQISSPALNAGLSDTPSSLISSIQPSIVTARFSPLPPPRVSTTISTTGEALRYEDTRHIEPDPAGQIPSAQPLMLPSKAIQSIQPQTLSSLSPLVVESRREETLRTQPILEKQGRLSQAAAQPIPTQPTIRINIGRVEVRAVSDPARVTPKASVPPTPRLSLEDYLRSRNGGR